MDFSEVLKDEYIEELVDYLGKFEHLFVVSNTQYLKRNVLAEIPQDWINFYKTQSSENQIPETYDYFLNKRKTLKINFEKVEELTDSNINSIVFKKVTLKKQYEIQNFAEVIVNLCSGKIDMLVNCGSGLGYLCNHLLIKNKKFKILGLEASEEKVATATERLLEYNPENSENIMYITHYVTEESDIFIQNHLANFGRMNSDIAIIGLHSCADLTIAAINLFFRMDSVKKLIIMPCCYHKLKTKNVENTEFLNIPLSSKLKRLVLRNETSFINRPFLRLACQQTTSRWDGEQAKRFQDAKNMFERGILECMLDEDEMVEKSGKPGDHHKISKLTFEEITEKYNLIDKNSGAKKVWTPEHRLRFDHQRSKYPDGEELTDFLSFLQAKLQAMCENLVLVDRLLYMNETAQNLHIKLRLSVKKLPNDKLTPRCFILIAEKH